MLETNGVDDAVILAARHERGELPIACDATTCFPGSAVPTGAGGLEPACTLTDSCSFVVLQLDQSDGMGFQDGPVAEIPVVCSAPAEGLLSLADVEVSNDNGELVPLCAEPASA